jgi:hypothetical protein
MWTVTYEVDAETEEEAIAMSKRRDCEPSALFEGDEDDSD